MLLMLTREYHMWTQFVRGITVMRMNNTCGWSLMHNIVYFEIDFDLQKW